MSLPRQSAYPSRHNHEVGSVKSCTVIVKKFLEHILDSRSHYKKREHLWPHSIELTDWCRVNDDSLAVDGLRDSSLARKMARSAICSGAQSGMSGQTWSWRRRGKRRWRECPRDSDPRQSAWQGKPGRPWSWHRPYRRDRAGRDGADEDEGPLPTSRPCGSSTCNLWCSQRRGHVLLSHHVGSAAVVFDHAGGVDSSQEHSNAGNIARR